MALKTNIIGFSKSSSNLLSNGGICVQIGCKKPELLPTKGSVHFCTDQCAAGEKDIDCNCDLYVAHLNGKEISN